MFIVKENLQIHVLTHTDFHIYTQIFILTLHV